MENTKHRPGLTGSPRTSRASLGCPAPARLSTGPIGEQRTGSGSGPEGGQASWRRPEATLRLTYRFDAFLNSCTGELMRKPRPSLMLKAIQEDGGEPQGLRVGAASEPVPPAAKLRVQIQMCLTGGRGRWPPARRAASGRALG